MAEFQEVVKQFKRLCDSANQDCSKCGLNDMACSIADIVNNSIEFERRVMSWAAEHPEPVYPSWGEYLHTLHHEPSSRELSRPIPPDIAQKLGIEPLPKT